VLVVSFVVIVAVLLIHYLYLLLVYLDFIFLLDSVLVGSVFLEMYLFLPGCVIPWPIIVHSSFMILCISAASVMSSFSFLILSFS